jgi:hypothetical protein
MQEYGRTLAQAWASSILTNLFARLAVLSVRTDDSMGVRKLREAEA